MLKHIPFYASLLNRELSKGIKATTSHVLVYGAVEAHSMGYKGCIASNKTIAQETGLSESTVASQLSRLHAAGWIKVNMKNGHRQSIEPLMVIKPPFDPHQTPLQPPSNIEDSNKNTVIRPTSSDSDTTPAKATHSSVPETATQLAELLHGLIAKRDPRYGKRSVKQVPQWAVIIDKTQRIDEYTYEEIESVIRWCQEDEFWQKNILSADKLRKQMHRLLQEVPKVKKKNPYDKIAMEKGWFGRKMSDGRIEYRDSNNVLQQVVNA